MPYSFQAAGKGRGGRGLAWGCVAGRGRPEGGGGGLTFLLVSFLAYSEHYTFTSPPRKDLQHAIYI